MCLTKEGNVQQETVDRYSSHLAQNPEDRVQQLEDHRLVREAFAELDDKMLAVLPAGRYRSLVLTALEEAAMWANKAVASPYPVHPEISVATQGQDAFAAHQQMHRNVTDETLSQATPDGWPRHDVED